MQRLRIGRLLAGSLLLAAGLGAGGCADNESMLFVRGVIARLNGTCTVPSVPDDGTLILLGGVLDTALTDHYDAALIVGSQLTERGDREELKTESSRIQIRGAEIQISDGLDLAFTVDATGFVDPSGSSEPGYGVAFVQLIPPGQALPANGQLRVQVRVFGDTLGGTEIESGPLLFPISVCSGCLISFPTDAWDKALSPNAYDCNSEDTPTTEICSIGQDEPVDCRFCAASNPACRAP